MAAAVNTTEVQAQSDVAAQTAANTQTTTAGAPAAQPNPATPVNTSESVAIVVVQDQVLLST